MRGPAKFRRRKFPLTSAFGSVLRQTGLLAVTCSEARSSFYAFVCMSGHVGCCLSAEPHLACSVGRCISLEHASLCADHNNQVLKRSPFTMPSMHTSSACITAHDLLYGPYACMVLPLNASAMSTAYLEQARQDRVDPLLLPIAGSSMMTDTIVITIKHVHQLPTGRRRPSPEALRCTSYCLLCYLHMLLQ